MFSCLADGLRKNPGKIQMGIVTRDSTMAFPNPPEGEDVKGLLEELWTVHVASWLPRFAATLQAEAKVPALKAAGALILEAVS